MNSEMQALINKSIDELGNLDLDRIVCQSIFEYANSVTFTPSMISRGDEFLRDIWRGKDITGCETVAKALEGSSTYPQAELGHLLLTTLYSTEEGFLFEYNMNLSTMASLYRRGNDLMEPFVDSKDTVGDVVVACCFHIDTGSSPDDFTLFDQAFKCYVERCGIDCKPVSQLVTDELYAYAGLIPKYYIIYAHANVGSATLSNIGYWLDHHLHVMTDRLNMGVHMDVTKKTVLPSGTHCSCVATIGSCDGRSLSLF